MEILQLVDQFEALISTSWRVPLTSRVLVSEAECLRLIDQMRITVPEVVKQAQRALGERDRILAQAKEESERIITRARERSFELVDEHELVEMAEERSQQILNEAEESRRQMQREADEYAVSVLSNLRAQLDKAIAEIENGVAALQPPAES